MAAGGRCRGQVAAALMVLLGLVLGLYAFDIWLVASGDKWGDHRFSVHSIPGADLRQRWEVVRDLRAQGGAAQLSAHPNRLPKPLVGSAGPILPLGGVSSRLTVLCNETGPYLTFPSDERGFNNPPGLWRPGSEILLVGDSFTQGMCPPADRHFARIIRDRVPATVNLGSIANGPLANLAGLREYVPFLRPAQVFWMHFEGNDLADLNGERSREFLLQYLEPTFRQGLIDRQPEIDRLLDQYLDAGIDERQQAARIAEPTAAGRALDVVLMRHLRHFFKLKLFSPPDKVPADYALFARVLGLAKAEVEQVGGTLTLFYLPQLDLTYYGLDLPDQPERVRDICQRLGVGFVDVRTEFVRRGGIAQFFYHPGSHYNDAGNRIVGEMALAAVAGRRR